MRIIALKQCDAWTPVSRGETPLAGKLALFPDQAYEFPTGTQFSQPPPMQKDRANRRNGEIVSADKAVKDGLIKRVRE